MPRLVARIVFLETFLFGIHGVGRDKLLIEPTRTQTFKLNASARRLRGLG
jgi:hypothetical protein